MEDALCGLDEEENAHRAVSGLVRKMGQADYHTFREKLVGYLRRRGFNPQAVRATVERSWTELTDPAYSHIGRNAHEQQPKDERD